MHWQVFQATASVYCKTSKSLNKYVKQTKFMQTAAVMYQYYHVSMMWAFKMY